MVTCHALMVCHLGLGLVDWLAGMLGLVDRLAGRLGLVGRLAGRLDFEGPRRWAAAGICLKKKRKLRLFNCNKIFCPVVFQ